MSCFTTVSFKESYTNSENPIVGTDLRKGLELSPYCSIKFLRSFFPEKAMPCSSPASLSNQLAAKKSSDTESADELKVIFLDFIS